MSDAEKQFDHDGKDDANVQAVPVDSQAKHGNGALMSLRRADDVLLAKLGYKSEFRREFSVSLSGC